MAAPDDALIARFAAITGEAHALRDPARIAPHLVDWRGAYRSRSPLVLKPATTAEVSAILALAQETATPVVAQGGNTGLVGGSVPDDSGTAIVLSLSRMNRIRAVDADGATMTVDAGVTVEAARAAAAEAGLLYPLALASMGTAQIGGTLSTNAGGIGALAHGVARDLCLGLEVVLAGGAVLNGLRVLKKDNRGYDLKHLFIGAEGTLGVITAASLRLAPLPAGRARAWAAMETPAEALALLRRLRARCGTGLTAFELCGARSVAFAVRHAGARAPFAAHHPWLVLVEVSSGRSEADAAEALQAALAGALEEGRIRDAVIAATGRQFDEAMALREAMSDAQRPEGVSIKHDISLPVAAIPDFIAQAGEAVQAAAPGARVVCFGHMGDGNLHYNVSQPDGADGAAFAARGPAVSAAVHGLVAAFGGSFSAEHGIGRMKRALLAETHDPATLALMRTLKAALDPAGILNPGVLL